MAESDLRVGTHFLTDKQLPFSSMLVALDMNLITCGHRAKPRNAYDLAKLDHSDKLSAFSWSIVNPVKEKTDPITITYNHSSCSMLYNEKNGVNYSTQP